MRTITVVAGVIWRHDGLILISKRPQNIHQGGLWELPGGKLEPGETAAQALEREVMEELGVTIQAVDHFGTVEHQYPDKHVTLVGLHSQYISGEPRCIEVDDFRWLTPYEAEKLRYPAANTKLFAYPWNVPPENLQQNH